MSIRQQSTLIRPFIAANSTLPINIAGRYCYLVDAASPMEIRVGDQPASLFSPGTGVAFDEGSDFERIEVRNTTAYDQFVSLWIGFAQYLDRRTALIEPDTIISAWVGTSIASATGQSFPPILLQGRIRRKAITIDNQDPSLPLHVRDTSGEVALHVRAETTITLPISREIEVYNPHGAAVACSVSEIYWVQ